MSEKNKFVINLSIISLLFVGSLISCQSKKANRTTSEDCLPPLFEFSYPYEIEGITEDIHTLPSITGIMPQMDENGVPITIWEGKVIVRGDDEIWLVEPLMRYTPSTKEIKEYEILDDNWYTVFPGSLFLGSDKTLYVEAGNSTRTGIVFAQYDDQSDSFKVISPENNIFLGGYVGGGHDIAEDQGGNFWFVYNNVLTRFNPSTRQVEQILGEKQGYILHNSLVKSSDDTLLIAAEKLRETLDGEVIRLKLNVVEYNIQTGEIRHWGTPPGLTDLGGHMFIDHQNHLWFNDFGYLDLNEKDYPTWYRVIRSPIFISDRSGNYQYVWDRPEPRVETNGRFLWFTFSGLARLDLETKEWCLVTRTRVYRIAKDSQENLWFISNNQLYKYEFQP